MSARFDKQDEYNQFLDETDLFININDIHNLTETDLVNIYVKRPLQHQIHQQEMKFSGWRFDKINSMTTNIFTKLVKLMVQIMLKFL